VLLASLKGCWYSDDPVISAVPDFYPAFPMFLLLLIFLLLLASLLLQASSLLLSTSLLLLPLSFLWLAVSLLLLEFMMLLLLAAADVEVAYLPVVTNLPAVADPRAGDSLPYLFAAHLLWMACLLLAVLLLLASLSLLPLKFFTQHIFSHIANPFTLVQK
jgi:hypothetical protein